jgi:hypothetical protein
LPERLNRKVALEAVDRLGKEVKSFSAAWEASNGRLNGTKLDGILMNGSRREKSVVYCDAHWGKEKPPEETCAFLQSVVADEKAPLDHRWGAIKFLSRLKQLKRLMTLAENTRQTGPRAEAIVYLGGMAVSLKDEKAYLRALELYKAQTDPIARALTADYFLRGPYKSLTDEHETEEGRREAERWWQHYMALVAEERKANKDDPIIQYIIDAAVAKEEFWREAYIKRKTQEKP